MLAYLLANIGRPRYRVYAGTFFGNSMLYRLPFAFPSSAGFLRMGISKLEHGR